MKVIFITHYSGWGGANKALLQMILWLRRKYGVEALVLMASKGPFDRELEKACVAYKNIPFGSWRGDYNGINKVWCAVKFTLRSLLEAVRFKCQYGECGYDLVHGNSSLTGFAYFLSRVLRIPLVWHQREYGDVDYPMQYLYGEKFSGRIIGRATAVIAISDAVKAYYSEFVVPQNKLIRIYDGVDFLEGECVGENSFLALINDGDFKICMVGGVGYGKNQLEVLKALSYLKEHGKMGNIKFYIVGSKAEGSYGAMLSQFIESNKLADVVTFIPPQREVGAFYKKMDMLVCASQKEGFGLVVVEAMMCGLPVVVNDQGALPELVKDGVHGYVYHLGKPQELAEAILKVKGGGLGPGIRDRVKEYALRNFSAERNADEVYALYKRVVH